MRWFCCLALLPLGLVLTSCSGGGAVADRTLVAELRRSRDLWASRHVAGYRYTLQVSCFCPPPLTDRVVIEVRNGVRTSITFAGSGAPAPAELFAQYDSVEKLFAFLEREINAPADRISADYDPASGYPVDVFIDRIEPAADDELGLSVRSFEIIP